jgi:hypothetical protein
VEGDFGRGGKRGTCDYAASVHRPESTITFPTRLLVSSNRNRYPEVMGEHIEQRGTERPRIARKRPGKQTVEAIGRQLLQIVVYDKRCRIGGTVTLGRSGGNLRGR